MRRRLTLVERVACAILWVVPNRENAETIGPITKNRAHRIIRMVHDAERRRKP